VSPPAAIAVRDATPADAPAIERLARASWPATYDGILADAEIEAFLARHYAPARLVEQIRACAGRDDAHFLLAQADGEPVGYLHFAPGERGPELSRLYVDPGRLGAGVGTALLAALHGRLPPGSEYTLLVHPRNIRARRFYAARGFVELGAVHGTWGCDLLVRARVAPKAGARGPGTRGAGTVAAMPSHMRETMARQPDDLRSLLAERAQVDAAAAELAGRRIYLIGTGTSWHAANHGAWFLRAAGVDAQAVQSVDAALHGPCPGQGDGALVLAHTGSTRFTREAAERARAAGAVCFAIGARGTPGADVETVAPERSSAYTGSHLAALLRLAQLADLLGAELGDLEAVPDAVARALEGDGPGVTPPERLLEFTGAGPNQWTAAEGALKVRETCYVATEGLSMEQLFHGPSVALGQRDALVCLDGGGPGAERLEGVAAAAATCGVRVHRIAARELGEQLSVFPLTVAVQRIALELAEQLGTNPDDFGASLPGHAVWEALGF